MQQSKGTPWRRWGGAGISSLEFSSWSWEFFPHFSKRNLHLLCLKENKKILTFPCMQSKKRTRKWCVAQLSAPACSVQGVGSTRPFTNSRPRGSGSGSAPGDYHSRDFPLHRCLHDSSCQSPWSRKVILWDIHCIHFNPAHKTPMETSFCAITMLFPDSL